MCKCDSNQFLFLFFFIMFSFIYGEYVFINKNLKYLDRNTKRYEFVHYLVLMNSFKEILVCSHTSSPIISLTRSKSPKSMQPILILDFGLCLSK